MTPRWRLWGAVTSVVLLLLVGVGSFINVSAQWQPTLAPQYSYTNLVLTNGIVIIKRAAGVLHSVTVNNTSTDVDSLLQLCDTNERLGCSATSTTIATIGSATSTMTYLYDIAFTRGLVVYATSTTAANVTLTWQ